MSADALYLNDIQEFTAEEFLQINESQMYQYMNNNVALYGTEWDIQYLYVDFVVPMIEERENVTTGEVNYWLVNTMQRTSLAYWMIDACVELYPLPSDVCFNNLINRNTYFDFEYGGEVYTITPIMYQLTLRVDEMVDSALALQQYVYYQTLFEGVYGAGDIVIPEFGE